MEDKTVVILAGDGESTNIIYNALKSSFKIEKVIIERRISKVLFLKNRIKKIGFFKVFGQALFQLIAVPYLRLVSRKRIMRLKQESGMENSPIDSARVIRVASANSDETKAILQKINPAVVVINGTRIILDRILISIPAKFINLHAGITPLYRGVHGAYWALIESNKKDCGVTVHFVDAGIDTGDILEQGTISLSNEDNFVTYPYLQLAEGIELLKKAINDILKNQIDVKPYPEGLSKLWSHPTLFEYIWYRIYYGIR
ncbi:MAG: formyl transferase [Candidatus Omnitrophota bacterium]|nr:formyl transferase [Candidatus Omnitrophota bacterium]